MLFVLAIAIYAVFVGLALRRGFQHRQVAAFLLAPLAPCIVGAVVSGDVFWLLVMVPFAYLFAIAGLPFYLLYRRFGWLRVWHIVPTAGLLGGAIAFAVGFSHIGSTATWANALLFAGYGAIAGLAFWLIAFAGPRSNYSLKRTAADGLR